MAGTIEAKSRDVHDALWRFGDGNGAKWVQVEWLMIGLDEWNAGARDRFVGWKAELCLPTTMLVHRVTANLS